MERPFKFCLGPLEIQMVGAPGPSTKNVYLEPCWLLYSLVKWLFAVIRVLSKQFSINYISHEALSVMISGWKMLGCIIIFTADSRFAPSQWETALLCNNVYHWLGANRESALIFQWWPSLLTHICVTRPRWVKPYFVLTIDTPLPKLQVWAMRYLLLSF